MQLTIFALLKLFQFIFVQNLEIHICLECLKIFMLYVWMSAAAVFFNLHCLLKVSLVSAIINIF